MQDISIEKMAVSHLNECFNLINELAIYEKAKEEVSISLEELVCDFQNNSFAGFVALSEQKVVGMALYYYVYSTWKGKSMYLEDLIVSEPYRNKGVGNKLFNAVKFEAGKQNMGRLSWQVLDWNEAAIAFYKKQNAILDGEWFNVKLTNSQLKHDLQNHQA